MAATRGHHAHNGDRLRPDTRLDSRWCGDVTYIRTWEGWAYLATVIDLASRRVVGWALADHMRTDLVADALRMACTHRRPPAVVIFHSDRGCAVRLNYCDRRRATSQQQAAPTANAMPAWKVVDCEPIVFVPLFDV